VTISSWRVLHVDGAKYLDSVVGRGERCLGRLNQHRESSRTVKRPFYASSIRHMLLGVETLAARRLVGALIEEARSILRYAQRGVEGALYIN
jgi:hypothetical protein